MKPVVEEKPLVLYVEDDPGNWEVAELRLRARFRLVWARTDREACELATKFATSLHAVLMDVELKGSQLDGRELTKLFRGRPDAQRPDFARDVPKLECPLFFVTAFGNLHGDDALKQCGGDGVVPKPVDFVKLTLLLARTNMQRAMNTLQHK